jgi:uncharacterized membrane protein YkoI
MVNTTDKVMLGILAILLVGMSGVFITAMTGTGNVVDDSSARKVYSKQVLLAELTPEDAKVIALKTVPGVLGEVEVEHENGLYLYDVEVIQDDVTKEVLINADGEIISIKDEEVDVPIAGTPLEIASAAALEHLGEGRVTETEIGDEDGFYEVEITLDNGDEVDVHLDADFNVLSIEY